MFVLFSAIGYYGRRGREKPTPIHTHFNVTMIISSCSYTTIDGAVLKLLQDCQGESSANYYDGGDW